MYGCGSLGSRDPTGASVRRRPTHSTDNADVAMPAALRSGSAPELAASRDLLRQPVRLLRQVVREVDTQLGSIFLAQTMFCD